jgi:hypothetical protein
MIAPTKGASSPSRVAVATSQGSSTRRRASLKTQNAVASQKIATKKMVMFRITSHAPESKKSLTPPKSSSFVVVAARITGSAFPRYSQRRTPSRR